MAQEIIVEDGAAINGEITTVTTDMLPKIVYKGVPVITSDLLAKVYGVETKYIRQNFNRNKDRFVEGKHFFAITGKEIKDLCQGDSLRGVLNEGVDKSDVLTPHLRGSRITVYTDRGAARHAKLLNTDSAWEMFEQLEDTFFAVLNGTIPAPAPQPIPLTKSTVSDRDPLKDLVDAWVSTSPMPHRAAWKQVHAHFGITAIGDLPKEWIADAIAFVQARIDKAQAQPKALPESPKLALQAAQAEDLRAKAMAFYNKVMDANYVWNKEMAEVERLGRELTDAMGAAIMPMIGSDSDPASVVARHKFLDALKSSSRCASRSMDVSILALIDHAQFLCGLTLLGR